MLTPLSCARATAVAGACLIVGPAQVLSGGQDLHLPSSVNLGLNAQGIHIMDTHAYRSVSAHELSAESEWQL